VNVMPNTEPPPPPPAQTPQVDMPVVSAAGSGSTAGMGGVVAGTAGAGAGAGGSPPEAGSMAEPMGARDPSCDMNGIWMGKQVAVGLALEAPQFVNTWSYLEIEQSGIDFVVTKHIDCGLEVRGTVTVTLTRATLQGAVQYNMQSGRTGTFELKDGKCVFDIARYWSVRGADEQRFIPNPTRDSSMSMAEVKALKPLPTPARPDGAIDLENDGELGAAAQVTGIVSGTRNSVQRDWNRWFSAANGFEIPAAMDFTSELKIRAEYEIEEIVMAPTTGLLTTLPDQTDTWNHVMRLRFLGRTAEDPRAQPIVKSDPVETCFAIQDAMPAEMLQQQ
jgi:hypothetical protein